MGKALQAPVFARAPVITHLGNRVFGLPATPAGNCLVQDHALAAAGR